MEYTFSNGKDFNRELSVLGLVTRPRPDQPRYEAGVYTFTLPQVPAEHDGELRYCISFKFDGVLNRHPERVVPISAP